MTPNKLDGLTLDLESANKDKLRAVFPECFTEGRLDIDKLLSLCGEYITDDFEKYEFKWKGKSDCLRLAQKRSTATLRPVPGDSVNWGTTQNLYIEGDNLEVLKLLQKSYFRKVKMIYIDPPYNTGNDFVYEDDFADPLARYKEVTAQTTKSNPETMGRYHTNWLNMMYPRLRLAANLLRDDGIIFISIDDTEAANLRKLCDEIMGEENFRSDISWQKRYTRSNNTVDFTTVIEHIFVYSKSSAFNVNLLPRTEAADSRYSNPDGDPRGVWKGASFLNPATPAQRPNLCYPITNPNTGTTTHPTTNAWRRSEDIYKELLADNRLYWGLDGKSAVPSIKMFLSEARGLTPINFWEHEYAGNTDEGTADLLALMGAKIFENPKPVKLIIRALEHATFLDQNDVILDFFSGSATTAHAVMQLNAEDGGNRRFIMVQLPEICAEKSEAARNGYPNICEIGKERIRRAGQKLIEAGKDIDTGFKVFRLDNSNLKLWDDTPIENGDLDSLFARMDGIIDNLKPGRCEDDLVYEILLKMGYPLTADVAFMEMDGLTVYTVEQNSMLICLQPGVTAEVVEKLAALGPQKIVLAENALADNSAMSNAHYLLENLGIELKIV
jgi:adenine-specific DNA-methyltransferase